jgi:hypothetical protein
MNRSNISDEQPTNNFILPKGLNFINSAVHETQSTPLRSSANTGPVIKSLQVLV